MALGERHPSWGLFVVAWGGHGGLTHVAQFTNMPPKSQVTKFTSVTNESVDEKSSPMHPGRFIEETILKSLNQSELADKLDVTKAAVNMLIKGKRRLTAGMAMRLEKFSGKPAQFWLDLQQEWDEWSASSAGRAHEMEVRAEKLIREWMTLGPRILTNAEIAQAIDTEFLDISPFSRERVKAASYDLTVGKVFCFGSNKQIRMDEDDCFQLQPHKLYTISTLEEIQLSRRVLARVAPPTDLIEQGLFFSLGLHVDPGFGLAEDQKTKNLICVVENRTNKVVSIGSEDVFLSCEITFLAREALSDDSELFPGRGEGGEFSRHYNS